MSVAISSPVTVVARPAMSGRSRAASRANRAGFIAVGAAKAAGPRGLARLRPRSPHPIAALTRASAIASGAAALQHGVDRAASLVADQGPASRWEQTHTRAVIAANGAVMVTGMALNRLLLTGPNSSDTGRLAAGVMSREIAVAGLAGMLSIGSERVVAKIGGPNNQRRNAAMLTALALVTLQGRVVRKANRAMPSASRPGPLPRQRKFKRARSV